MAGGGVTKKTDTSLAFRRQPFRKIVRRMMYKAAATQVTPDDYGELGLRIKTDAVNLVQAVTEQYVVNLITRANKLTTYARRKTVSAEDLQKLESISK